MADQKVILLCSSRFAIPALRELLFFNQLAVVVIPGYCEDMLEQSKIFLTGSSVPLLEVDKTNCEQLVSEAIAEHGITLGLVMSFPYKITAAVINLPPKGFFNIHPGPLPAYRGADPVFQQIKNREKHAGVTIHKLDEGLDTGPVVMQEMMRLDVNDSYGLLTTKLAAIAGRMSSMLTRLAGFEVAIPSRKQDESKAVYYKKQKAGDIMIDWEKMSAPSIVALINACNPWNKGAVTKLNGNIVRLLEAESLGAGSGTSQQAGTIIVLEADQMIISAIDDEAVKVKVVYIEEGFLMPGRLRQLGIVPGNRFEAV